jgi:DNA mismatch repair ATPase MutS
METGWNQEKYIACIRIYESYLRLEQEDLGIHYLILSYKFDKKRIDGIYRLVKYYCILNLSDIAYKFYSLIQDYFEIHNFYSEIYGKMRTIILMQVGAFHECYSCDIEGLDLITLAGNLNIVCTKKNSKEPVSESNPRMLGFPVYTTDNFIEKLINFNFTVVKIDQVSDPPKPKREVVGIYSPATFIHTKMSNNTNYISSIVIDNLKNNICIGLASYDLSTGYGYYFETCSTKNDTMLSLDDAVRFLNTYSGREIIVYHNLNEDEQINNMSITNILNYIGCNEKMVFEFKNKNTNKLSFQKLLFDDF